MARFDDDIAAMLAEKSNAEQREVFFSWAMREEPSTFLWLGNHAQANLSSSALMLPVAYLAAMVPFCELRYLPLQVFFGRWSALLMYRIGIPLQGLGNHAGVRFVEHLGCASAIRLSPDFAIVR